ncbi:hypothetical protein EDB83DRAFT_1843985 [Lactarius deliciosus]|nr:hypothetical protein EDB83DRAFT_1843985 [Lactarius deliciosus]
MASPSVDVDLEAQSRDVPEAQPEISPDPPPTNIADPQLPTGADSQSQATNSKELHVPKTVGNSDLQRDENHGDPSDGLWAMYLTEAEKQDKEVTESWKGDTDGILVFTGLFSATVAAFIIESYKMLSPDSSNTTNALLTQISVQLVNISNGTPLASVAVQGSQSFKPTASAVRVNVFWFLSLVLSLNCALSATLIQQWARRYQELAQRRGANHRRGRMRAYIFDGLSRFRMAQAVATMPKLLHISVFLFFAGLVEFLFPIDTTVAYATLGCIMVFALAHVILTVLPNIYLNCPYGTPLSGFTWRISQLSVFGFLWTILKMEGLFRQPLLKFWSLANQHVTDSHMLKTCRETLEREVKTRRQWFSQGLRKSIELGAYRAESRVVTSALEWTLTALDEDKEIEDFAARVPGFFDSRVVPDATLVLSLMSHQPNTDPVLGSRLYDLLKTCIPETSVLDEKTRKNRLRICVNCLWYFGRAYNQHGVSQLLPPYFPDFLIPEITRRIQAEDDSTLRVIGRCFVALITNKLAADINSRNIPVSDAELACLSTILSTKRQDVALLLRHPGAIECTSMVFLAMDDIYSSKFEKVPLYVLDMVRQTLSILSRALPAELNAKMRLDQTSTLMNVNEVTSSLTAEMYRSVLCVFLKILWYFGRAYNEPGNSVPLPSYVFIAFTNPEMTRRIRMQRDLAVRVIGRYVRSLVVNKLAADISSRTIPASEAELVCLSAILGTRNRHDVVHLLSHPGAIEFTNLVFLALGDVSSLVTNKVSLDTRHVLQQTFTILSHALPAELNAKMRLLDQTDTLMNSSDGTSSLTAEMYRSILRVWTKNLWHFTREYNEPSSSVPLPSYVCITFTNPEMSRRIREHRDPTVCIIGRCIEALVVTKLAADINSCTIPAREAELACLSTILGTKSDNVILLLRDSGAIELTSVVFLASGGCRLLSDQ